MPSLSTLRHLRNYISHLNPSEVREMAERPIVVGLVASGSDGYADMEEWLVPRSLSRARQEQGLGRIYRSGEPNAPTRFDLVLYEQGLPCPVDAFTFYRQAPEITVKEIIEQRNDITIPLAANFQPFRRPVSLDIINRVARENALFTLATSVPFLMPFLGLGLTATQFASDTAFLTINQIRMAFLLAAANDRSVGYGEQKTELASVVASAFGWRALARELAGMVRLGGGIIPKGAIAYAGTFVLGAGIERLYSAGYELSRLERSDAYREAYERGKSMIEGLFRKPQVVNPA
jgi:hypothetical protein